MSTIRPLATIAILAGLGVFLAQQINGPQDTSDQLTANWGEAPAYEVGGMSEAPGYDANSLAPPIASPAPGAPSLEAPSVQPPPIAPPAASVSSSSPQEGLPPLPSLPTESAPPLAASPAPTFPGAPPVTNDLSDEIPMPDDVAEANYEGVPVDSLPNDPLAGLPPAAPAVPAGRYGAAPSGVPPLGDSPVPGADPYQSYTPPAAEAAAPMDQTPEGYQSLGQMPAAGEPGFHDALPAINQALERNELTRAHALLSSWYGDPSLTPLEREKVEQLLSQLAGTVVYSTEHRLEPAYTVKPGDTLKTIADQYQVPWRLLAKINGVPNAQSIQVGQTLKVLRGPFAAVVDAKGSKLVLMIDGKYAGKFPVQLSGAATQEGDWRVSQKPDGAPDPLGTPTSKQLVLSDPSGMAKLVIAAGGASPMERGRLSVAANDLEELHDILSVGSEVKIRR